MPDQPFCGVPHMREKLFRGSVYRKTPGVYREWKGLETPHIRSVISLAAIMDCVISHFAKPVAITNAEFLWQQETRQRTAGGENHRHDHLDLHPFCGRSHRAVKQSPDCGRIIHRYQYRGTCPPVQRPVPER